MNWLMNEESGQGLVEYGLILALVAVVCMVGLGKLAQGANATFKEVSDALGTP